MTLFTCFLINWITYTTVQPYTETPWKGNYHIKMNLLLRDILTSCLLTPPKYIKCLTMTRLREI